MSKSLALVEQEKAHHAVSRLGRVLGVPRASCDAWKADRPSRRALEDAWLTSKLRQVHQASRGT